MTLDFGRSDVEQTQDNLIAGPVSQLVEQGVTISTGTLVRGQVLGRITTTGQYKAWNPASSDGSENAKAILAEDVDASSAVEKGVAYFAGHFNFAGVTFLPSIAGKKDHVLDAILALQGLGVYITGYGQDLLESTHTSTTTTTTTTSSTTTTTTAP